MSFSSLTSSSGTPESGHPRNAARIRSRSRLGEKARITVDQSGRFQSPRTVARSLSFSLRPDEAGQIVRRENSPFATVRVARLNWWGGVAHIPPVKPRGCGVSAESVFPVAPKLPHGHAMCAFLGGHPPMPSCLRSALRRDCAWAHAWPSSMPSCLAPGSRFRRFLSSGTGRVLTTAIRQRKMRISVV